MDGFRISGYKPITYEHRGAVKKDKVQESQDNLNPDKNSLRKLAAEAPAYDVIANKYDSYRLEYFEEINKSTDNGISGAMKKYESLYNDILQNTPEGKTRDCLVKELDKAFEMSGVLYGKIMAARMTSLSGTKLHMEPLVMGSNKLIKTDRTGLDSILKKNKVISDEIESIFANAKNHFVSNRSFSNITNNKGSVSSSTLKLSDLDTLSKGLMKDLQDMQKSGASKDDISKKIEQSDLNDSARQLLHDIVNADQNKK